MGEIIRHSDKCVVKQVASGKTVEAVVHEFKINEKLTVILNQSVKLSMKWNGKVFEGKMAGLDFVTEGPSFKTTKTSIRG